MRCSNCNSYIPDIGNLKHCLSCNAPIDSSPAEAPADPEVVATEELEAGATVARGSIDRWPTEIPLLALIAFLALVAWSAIVLSIIGLVYALIIGVAVFVAQAVFIAHLRGNAVRLGPEQMPDLYNRVRSLSSTIGLKHPPDTYVLEAGGSLNALATRFFRSNFIVLFSDLLEACDENSDARDFIVAHELGHLHAGHLSWRWLLLPGMLVPFVGNAYSRACEYTCDRIGFNATRRSDKALEGLCILAAGKQHGPKVNRRALSAQQSDLDSVWMKIGEWLSTHPPIARRLAALDPRLVWKRGERLGATVVALSLAGLVTIAPVAVVAGLTYQLLPQLKAELAGMQESGAMAEAERGIISLAEAVEYQQASANQIPQDVDALYAVWAHLHPDQPEPVDPFHGGRFQYEADNPRYAIWSLGPDPNDEADDLTYVSEP